MDEKTVKKYYLVSGILVSLALIIGVIRLVDIMLQNHSLKFLDIYAIILLVVALLVIVAMLIHSTIIDKKQKRDAMLRANDSEKLKKYVSKKK